jgi:hypothetical protein
VFGAALPKGNLLLVDSSTAAQGVGGGISMGGSYNGTANYADWAYIKSGKNNSTAGDYGGYLAFGTRTNGASTAERMRIDTTGNVGIGTSTPATTLQVTGGTNPTILIGGGSIPGCLELGNSNGTSGINYITALNGTLTATTTKPSSCQ